MSQLPNSRALTVPKDPGTVGSGYSVHDIANSYSQFHGVQTRGDYELESRRRYCPRDRRGPTHGLRTRATQGRGARRRQTMFWRGRGGAAVGERDCCPGGTRRQAYEQAPAPEASALRREAIEKHLSPTVRIDAEPLAADFFDLATQAVAPALPRLPRWLLPFVFWSVCSCLPTCARGDAADPVAQSVPEASASVLGIVDYQFAFVMRKRPRRRVGRIIAYPESSAAITSFTRQMARQSRSYVPSGSPRPPGCRSCCSVHPDAGMVRSSIINRANESICMRPTPSNTTGSSTTRSARWRSSRFRPSRSTSTRPPTRTSAAS